MVLIAAVVCFSFSPPLVSLAPCGLRSLFHEFLSSIDSSRFFFLRFFCFLFSLWTKRLKRKRLFFFFSPHFAIAAHFYKTKGT